MEHGNPFVYEPFCVCTNYSVFHDITDVGI